MSSLKEREEDWIERIIVRDGVNLEEVVSQYETTVYSLAMHLTSDEESAKEVTAQVFIRFSVEHHKYPSDSIETLIHRFTYDAALPRLLGQIGEREDEVDTIGEQLSAAGSSLVC